MLEPRDTPQGRVGIAFAHAVIAGEYDVAYTMLSAALQTAMTPAQVNQKFQSMIEYGGSPPDFVDAITVLDDWPDKAATDLGWAYVAIAGDGYAEAVTIVVMQERTRLVIRQIEWGRP